MDETSALPSGAAPTLPFRLTAPSAWPLAVAGVTATATTYIALHNPHVPGALGWCPLYFATGLYCPGCGGTRAVYDLAHGDVLGAFQMHALLTLAVPVLAVLWVRWLMRTMGKALRPWSFPSWGAYAIGATLIAFSLVRNLPGFEFLRP